MAYMDGITCICDNGRTLEDHRPIVGDDVISALPQGGKSPGKRVLHVNSTYQSGGVAEMIVSLVPLMNSIGIDTCWNILHGDDKFFAITKNFHNALQGQAVAFSGEEKDLYIRTNETFSGQMMIDHDLVVIHARNHCPDPILPEIQPWVWRCHVDLEPKPGALGVPEGFYSGLRPDGDLARELPAARDDDGAVDMPAGDRPLSEKNRDLSGLRSQVSSRSTGADRQTAGHPDLTVRQVERPPGRCRRLLRGEEARRLPAGPLWEHGPDDPEGWAIYRQVEDAVRPSSTPAMSY